MKKRKIDPRHGDQVYEVEWCQDLPTDENGDADMDSATFARRNFATIEEARAYAKKVYPLCKLGSVMITLMEFVPYDEDNPDEHGPNVGFWEAATVDSEYYQGE
jgi:hypothetical protein